MNARMKRSEIEVRHGSDMCQRTDALALAQGDEIDTRFYVCSLTGLQEHIDRFRPSSHHTKGISLYFTFSMYLL